MKHLASVAVVLTVGCDPVLPTTPDAFLERDEVLSVRATPNRDLDLLFVIDDSPSMADKQAAVRAAFPAFAAQLASLDGGLPNLHLGVVSTDMGTTGSQVGQAGPPVGQVGNGGCAGTGKAGVLTTNGAAVTTTPYVTDVRKADGTRDRNYTGALEEVFGQMASLGAGGCGFEQPLHAMRVALANTTTNAGFLRPNATLGVIVLTDEDDCSLADPRVLGPESAELGPLQSFRCFQFGVECTPDDPRSLGAKTGCKARAASPYLEDVAPFHDFLAQLKPEPRDLMFGVLGGKPQVAVELRASPGGGPEIPAVKHSCTFGPMTLPSVADPPVRLDQLAASFGDRGRSEPICSTDVTDALVAMGRTAKQLVGDPCLTRAIAEPADCLVIDTAGGRDTALPRCGDGGNACWDLVVDAVRCDAVAQHLKLVVTRTVAPEADTVTTMRCVR
jgi:hypothetical protein